MRLCVLLTFHPFFFAGELPKELGNLANLTQLWLSSNEFQGELYVRTYMRCMFADISLFAGELPKELGKLINLTHFSVARNSIGGELYVPYYIHNLAMRITEFLCPCAQ